MRNLNGLQYDFKPGERFGRLMLTGYSVIVGVAGYRRRTVEAICDCGDISMYVFDSVQRLHTRSCGCLKRDLERMFPHNVTHGLSKHPLFKVYVGMKERCVNPNHNRYEYYGGKGVQVCQEWRDDFKTFFDWAILNGYKKGLTIHRKKSDKNYQPDNCSFVTYQRQRLEMDNIKLITAFGESKCISAWAEDERCSVTFKCLYGRFTQYKEDWPDIEEAITAPAKIRGATKKYKPENRMIFAFGEEKSMAEWLKDDRCVVSEEMLRYRLKKGQGWTPEKSLTTIQRKSPTKKVA